MVESFGNRSNGPLTDDSDELMGQPWRPAPPQPAAPTSAPVGVIPLIVQPMLDEQAMAAVCDQITEMVAAAMAAGIRSALSDEDGTEVSGA